MYNQQLLTPEIVNDCKNIFSFIFIHILVLYYKNKIIVTQIDFEFIFKNLWLCDFYNHFIF